MFDYEWAIVQHTVNCRLAQGVVVPDAIPPERLRRYGAIGKLHRYPGLKEEYYLADFEPTSEVLDELGLDPAEPIAVVRTPPAVSLYHRFENDLFASVLQRLRGTQVVVLPRTPEQRTDLDRVGGFIVPERAIDAQSLIAYADLVVSAGGTMNREAVALGTPVYTVFEGRLGAVDERLIAEGRLQRLTAAADVRLVKYDRSRHRPRIRRNPADTCRAAARSGANALLARGPGRCRTRIARRMRRRIRSAAFPVHRHSVPQLLVDGVLVALAYYLAFQLRFDDAVPTRYQHLLDSTLPWVVPVALVVLAGFGVYQRLWTYVSQRDFETVDQGGRRRHAHHRRRDRAPAPGADAPEVRLQARHVPLRLDGGHAARRA